VLKEGIVGFCELKMFKLGPSCVYKHNNGLGVIRTSYFARKSEALLTTVMSRNAEVYKIVKDRLHNHGPNMAASAKVISDSGISVFDEL
jgi:hypothetical protein